MLQARDVVRRHTRSQCRRFSNGCARNSEGAEPRERDPDLRAAPATWDLVDVPRVEVKFAPAHSEGGNFLVG